MPSISMRPGSDALLRIGPTVGVRIGLDPAFDTEIKPSDEVSIVPAVAGG